MDITDEHFKKLGKIVVWEWGCIWHLQGTVDPGTFLLLKCLDNGLRTKQARMFLVEGLSQNRIAKMERCSVGTVHMRIKSFLRYTGDTRKGPYDRVYWKPRLKYNPFIVPYVESRRWLRHDVPKSICF